MRNKLVIPSTIGHGHQLGNGNGKTDTDHKGNIGCSHYQRGGSQMFITDCPHHRRIDQVQAHLRQLTHDNRKRQLNGFIYFFVFPGTHGANRACKCNKTQRPGMNDL